VLGRKDAFVFAAGAAMTTKFMKERPDVARRWAAAYRKALDAIANDPTARDHLKGNTQVPAELVRQIGIPKAHMVDQLTDENRRDFQTYIDFAVSQGIVKEKLDASKYLVVLDK
jgi:NitT/TauT family transport system substrate-binding protein